MTEPREWEGINYRSAAKIFFDQPKTSIYIGSRSRWEVILSNLPFHTPDFTPLPPSHRYSLPMQGTSPRWLGNRDNNVFSFFPLISFLILFISIDGPVSGMILSPPEKIKGLKVTRRICFCFRFKSKRAKNSLTEYLVCCVFVSILFLLWRNLC